MGRSLSVDESKLIMQIPRRFHFAIKNKMAAVPGADLHKTQILTLMTLKENEPVTMVKLGILIGMEKGSFTQVVDKLVSLGYVERTRDPNDRRSVVVTLTEEGVTLTDEIERHANKETSRIVSSLSEEDINLLMDSLKNVEKIINKI